MLAGLRRMEDERLDEEMEVLRDLEMEDQERGGAGTTLVRDSQACIMPLGVDRGSEDDDDDDDDDDDNGLEGKQDERQSRDGKPFKAWKKKGQKRTTRRVIMKPSRSKPKPEPAWLSGGDPKSGDEVAVAETQVEVLKDGELDSRPARKTHSEHSDDASSDDSSNASHTPRTKKKNKLISSNGPKSTAPTAPTGGKDGIVKRAARKISATAHANYTRLKLRHKNSKGKGGGRGGGRFGRR